MILQRLVERYDQVAGDPLEGVRLPRQGYSLQKVSFCVVLNPDGTVQQVQSLLDVEGKRRLPKQILLPGQAKPTGSGLNPGFLWDNAAYMLGFANEDAKPERVRQAFESFRERHLAAERLIGSPPFAAVCAFLRHWTPEQCASIENDLRDTVSHFGVFRLAGEQRFIHEIVGPPSSDSAGDIAPKHAACLVTGITSEIARLHEPKIKGVRGAQSSGALLVSFNDQAYESYGREQSFNAPVGHDSTFKYACALNDLLNDTGRRIQLGDATIVFWAERPDELEMVVSDLFGEANPAITGLSEDRQRGEAVRLFLSQVQAGYAAGGAMATNGTKFYVLGLSPNASRLSVRLWYEATVTEMRARLAQHLSDIAIEPDADEPLTVKRLVRATGRAETDAKGHVNGYDDDSISPLLAGAVARAVLTGSAYPHTLLTAMVNRFRADGVINRTRIAAIKGCIVRNSRLRGQPEEVSVALDVGRTDAAYVTGRLFALLEKIQEESADSDLNATIKDRYFSSASATPAYVFPRLLRLSQHHLAKLDGGLKVHREKQLGEIVGKLPEFARQFRLHDQGLFAIGYYHQRQDLFTSRKDKEPPVQ